MKEELTESHGKCQLTIAKRQGNVKTGDRLPVLEDPENFNARKSSLWAVSVVRGP